MTHVGGTPTRTVAAWAALSALIAALLMAAGPAASSADAATACKRFGDTPLIQLRNRPARKSIVCLVNKERKQKGLSRLDSNRKLQKASQKHNELMVDKKCFAHECPGEPALDARLRNVGYLGGGLTRWAYGENIAWGEKGMSTPKSIMNAWMNSAGHRANILSPLFKEIGVGVSDGTPYSKNAKGGTFTTDFGLAQG